MFIHTHLNTNIRLIIQFYIQKQLHAHLLNTNIHTCIHKHTLTETHKDIHTCIHRYLLTYIHTNIKIVRDIHTTIRTKLHTYMQKNFHTYKHSK